MRGRAEVGIEVRRRPTAVVGAAVAGAAVAALAVLAPYAAAAPGPAAHGIAVVLCIDTSGSMTQSDPTGQRAATVDRLAGMLGRQDSLGIVTFSTTAHVLMPLRTMGTPAAAVAARAVEPSIGAGGWTDIAGALRAASRLLSSDPRSSDWHVAVLLTDGVPDMPSLAAPAAMAQYLQKMYAEAAAFRQKGWMLDTVGLGNAVSTAELTRLARLGGGSYRPALSAGVLLQRIVNLVSAAQADAHSGVAPPLHRPIASKAPPVDVRVHADGWRGVARPGATIDLLVTVDNATGPVPFRLQRISAPASWRLPAQWVAPPGVGTAELPVLVPTGATPGTHELRLRIVSGQGARRAAFTLRWSVWVPEAHPGSNATHTRPWWTPRRAGGFAGVLALLTLAIGYAGYIFRARPAMHARATLYVEDPSGATLGRLRVPDRREVLVGQAKCRTARVRVRWMPGDQPLFHLRWEGDVSGGKWRRGVRAWWSPPEIARYAEAAWPYHLYPGPVPQRRVDLGADPTFGVSGLTFHYRTRGEHHGAGEDRPGMDLLRGTGEPRQPMEAGPAPVMRG